MSANSFCDSVSAFWFSAACFKITSFESDEEVWRLTRRSLEKVNGADQVLGRDSRGFFQFLQPITQLVARNTQHFRGFCLISTTAFDRLADHRHLNFIERNTARRQMKQLAMTQAFPVKMFRRRAA